MAHVGYISPLRSVISIQPDRIYAHVGPRH